MKKILSLMLVIMMLVFALPVAYAADYTAGTQVVYTAANSESYTITVPASLKPGQSGTVTLAGEWPDNKTISVTADKTVTLTNSIKAADTKTLNVNFDGISETGSNIEAQTFTKSVSVDPIEAALFGTWGGKFNYNVDVTVAEEVPTKKVAGLYKAGTNFGELIYTWDEMVENDMVSAWDGMLGNISVDSNEHESVDLIISNTVTTLGCQCFDSATALETVVVPSSVTYMNDYIFWGIDTVILQAINPTMWCNTFGDGYNLITTDIYYAGSEAQWNAIQVECQCISIDPGAYPDCEYGGLYIPENATIHYNYTFE